MDQATGYLIKYGDFYIDHANEMELYGFLILASMVLCFFIYKIIIKILSCR